MYQFKYFYLILNYLDNFNKQFPKDNVEKILSKFEFTQPPLRRQSVQEKQHKIQDERLDNKDMVTALQVVDEILSEKENSTVETTAKKLSIIEDNSALDKLSKEINRPPVLLQRTELLKAIENQNIEIMALIDASPILKGIIFN